MDLLHARDWTVASKIVEGFSNTIGQNRLSSKVI